VLEFIRLSIKERGYPPSVREIGRALGLRSTSTVHAHLSKLRSAGYIDWDPDKPRTISLEDERGPRRRVVYVPLVGQVAAGQPLFAEENIEDTLPLPADFTSGGESFLLRVQGDSMVNAGILHGDYVIVRRQSDAVNRDIVVALLGDEATVKRFYTEGDSVRLQPENDYMEPILTRDVHVLGKVVGLLRRLY
jgi:repressor LexA